MVLKKYLLTLSIFIAIASPRMSNNGTEYSHYVLDVRWGPSICSVLNCEQLPVPRNPTLFTIHGLWPTYLSTRGPNFCKGIKDTYSYDDISPDLQQVLLTNWTGLDMAQDVIISHELGKHSTCWDPTSGDAELMPASVKNWVLASRREDITKYQIAENYLNLVMALAERHDIYKILKVAGIYPIQGKTYNIALIKNILEQTLGIQGFTLICKVDKYGRQLIEQVSLCFDKNFQLIDCPGQQSIKCKQSIAAFYLPSV